MLNICIDLSIRARYPSAFVCVTSPESKIEYTLWPISTQSLPGTGLRPRLSRPIHGIISVSVSISISTFQVSSPLLLTLYLVYFYFVTVMNLQIWIVLMPIDVYKIMLKVKVFCHRWSPDYNWWPWWHLAEVSICATSRLGLVSVLGVNVSSPSLIIAVTIISAQQCLSLATLPYCVPGTMAVCFLPRVF